MIITHPGGGGNIVTGSEVTTGRARREKGSVRAAKKGNLTDVVKMRYRRGRCGEAGKGLWFISMMKWL